MQKIVSANELNIGSKFWELYRGLWVLGPSIFILLSVFLSLGYIFGAVKWSLSFGIAFLIVLLLSVFIQFLVFFILFCIWVPGYVWLKWQETKLKIKLKENTQDWIHPCGDLYVNDQWLLSIPGQGYFFAVHRSYILEIGKEKRNTYRGKFSSWSAKLTTIRGKKKVRFGTHIAYKKTKQ